MNGLSTLKFGNIVVTGAIDDGLKMAYSFAADGNEVGLIKNQGVRKNDYFPHQEHTIGMWLILTDDDKGNHLNEAKVADPPLEDLCIIRRLNIKA